MISIGTNKPDQTLRKSNMEKGFKSSKSLAESITWAASKQTFYTIRFLVDASRVSDAYRAYAYFRWVDDQLDQEQAKMPERIAFVERQKALMEGLYRGQKPQDLTNEEHLLAELVHHDQAIISGLQSYIRNMMAVMVFDTYRRGRLISQKELNEYTRWLATAVTDALHHFIGHDCPAPKVDTRYHAVTAAHLVHMLRDTRSDAAAGYFNIPREFIETHGITAGEVDSLPYRLWVRNRVELARRYFKAGESYLAQVKNLRCRLAGYTYTARFTDTLDSIERNSYQVPADDLERKRPEAALRMSWSVLSLALNHPHPEITTRSRSQA